MISKRINKELYDNSRLATAREHEYKFAASKNEFEAIRSKLSISDCVKSVNRGVQINYYYDTVDCFFRKNKTTIRIRQKESGLAFQVKIRDYYGDHQNKELTSRIDKIPIHMQYEGYDLKLYGHLVTDRTRYLCNNGLTVDLDINFYCGIIDYEIEIELHDDKSEMDSVLFEDDSLSESKFGKSTRFFNRWEQYYDS